MARGRPFTLATVIFWMVLVWVPGLAVRPICYCPGDDVISPTKRASLQSTR